MRKERRRGHHREENRKSRESRKDMSEGVSAGREGVSDAHYLCDFHRVPVTINQMRFKKRRRKRKKKKKRWERWYSVVSAIKYFRSRPGNLSATFRFKNKRPLFPH